MDDNGQPLSPTAYFKAGHSLVGAFSAPNSKICFLSAMLFDLGLTFLTKKVVWDVDRASQECVSGGSSSSSSYENESVSAADAFQPSNGGLALTVCLTIASQAVAYMFDSLNRPLAEKSERVMCSGFARRVAEITVGAGFLVLAIGVRFAANPKFDSGEASLYAGLYFGALLLQWFVSEPTQLVLKFMLGNMILSACRPRGTASFAPVDDSYALMDPEAAV